MRRSILFDLLALAQFAPTPYPQGINPNGSPRRVEPDSWRDDALTIANLGHATLLMNSWAPGC
jgi:hypothetical protein